MFELPDNLLDLMLEQLVEKGGNDPGLLNRAQQEVGAFVKKKRKKQVTPDDILKLAEKTPGSALNQWVFDRSTDDAAREYYRMRCCFLVRKCKVNVPLSDGKVRKVPAFVSPVHGGFYIPTNTVPLNPSNVISLRKEAEINLAAWAERFSIFADEYPELFTLIMQFTGREKKVA